MKFIGLLFQFLALRRLASHLAEACYSEGSLCSFDGCKPRFDVFAKYAATVGLCLFGHYFFFLILAPHEVALSQAIGSLLVIATIYFRFLARSLCGPDFCFGDFWRAIFVF